MVWFGVGGRCAVGLHGSSTRCSQGPNQLNHFIFGPAEGCMPVLSAPWS